MNLLDLIFGCIGVISLAFSIFAHFRTETKKHIEIAKNAMVKEKLRTIESQLGLIFYNADLIVQIPKSRPGVAVEELQNMGRLIRAEAQLATYYLLEEKKKLDEYRFGVLVESVRAPAPPEK